MPTKLPTKKVIEVNHVIAGKNVREARNSIGKSLRWLALKMKISAPYMSDLERGRRNWTEHRYDAAMKFIRTA